MNWRLFLSVAVALWFSLALAAPRVGTHPGYTRLVFDLPGTPVVRVQSKKVTLPYLTLRLNTLLRAERGTLKAPGVVAYSVAGSAVNVTFAPGYGNPKIQVVPRQGSLPQRLVIDVVRVAPPKPAPKPAAKPAPNPNRRPAPAW
ncbi:hypothetical protein [Deinococcus wulumuqiensis]|uniref:hypothetical protein n=1 Tax=Deinococcus wulumuqiensis TaxID=980427 RepID=UPI001F0829E8|nr:hypothetical protein [Deinococcus wulumuqiensis]